MTGLPPSIGRYEIRQRIGRGGMGAVYLAHDPKIGRPVAIKVLKTDIERAELLVRFEREAKAIGSLAHQNIVVIHDYGEFDGSPFIVMEYIHGETVREIIEHRRPLAVSEKLQLLEQLCAGLEYAHRQGVLHRDIKPANLMVDDKGTLKILDFGIARLSESGVTRASGAVGTPGFMSPEQIQGNALDSRSDLFAVGAVAYELLAFREAFPGDNYHTVLHHVLHKPADRLSALVPDVDLELETLVFQTLEKEPARRYQDAGALRRAFAGVRSRLDSTSSGLDPALLPSAPTIKISRHTPTPGVSTNARKAAAERAEIAQRCLDEAQEALDRGDYRAADAALRRVEELNGAEERLPRLREELASEAAATVRGMLIDARSLVDQRKFTHAETVLSKVRELDPESNDARALAADVVAARRSKNAAPAQSKNAAWVQGLTASARSMGLSAGLSARQWLRRHPWVLVGGATAAVLLLAALAFHQRSPPAGELVFNPGGGGVVHANGAPCNDSATPCRFPVGTSITLTAHPNAGFLFAGFTGDCQGVRDGGTLTIGRPIMACSANFRPDTTAADAAFTKAADLVASARFAEAADALQEGTKFYPLDPRFSQQMAALGATVLSGMQAARDSVNSPVDAALRARFDAARTHEQDAARSDTDHNEVEAIKARAEAWRGYQDTAEAARAARDRAGPKNPPDPKPEGKIAPPPEPPRRGPVTFTLRMQFAGKGAVRLGTLGNCESGQPCNFPVPVGIRVELTATPPTGSQFIGFTGACKGGIAIVTADLDCVAEFKENPKPPVATRSALETLPSGTTGVAVKDGISTKITWIHTAGESLSIGHGKERHDAAVAGLGFWMDTMLVTNANFAAMMARLGYTASYLRGNTAYADDNFLKEWRQSPSPPAGTETQPVVYISQATADEYCRELGAALPTMDQLAMALAKTDVSLEAGERFEWTATVAVRGNSTKKLTRLKTDKDVSFRCVRSDAATVQIAK